MRIQTLVLFVLVCFINCRNQDKKANTDSESTEDTLNINILPIAEEVNGGLLLPEGFSALVVAESVGPARHLAVRDNGDIYIKLRTETGTNGNMALRDTTGDGRPDIYQKWGDYPNDGNFGTEMRIHNGYLYFSSEQVIYRQKLSPNKLIPDGKPEIILVDEFPKRWHNAKSLAFDNKGFMYVTFSAPTNACEDTRSAPGNVKGLEPCPLLRELGGIWRFDANKLGQFQADGELFATGIRSVVGLSWNHEDDQLYAVQHGRDYLHNHAPHYYSEWQQSVLPAEEFMRVEKDDNFGWPHTYYDHFKGKKMMAPEYGGDGKKEAKGFKDPILGFPAHWAPNDLLFYKGNQLPERYKKGAFIAFHGSTNRSPYPQAGYIVAFVPFANGKPTGQWEVFADGFAGADTLKTMQEAKYRPMGLAEGPDGSIYIAESKQGKIWKVSFKGDPKDFGEDELQYMEQRKSMSYIKTPDEVTDNLTLK
ncbi:MAG: PQQ-dependent sugar dehydrogenase [Flavobacteriaceae bacterium]